MAERVRERESSNLLRTFLTKVSGVVAVAFGSCGPRTVAIQISEERRKACELGACLPSLKLRKDVSTKIGRNAVDDFA
jgi:hypothetical protein